MNHERFRAEMKSKGVKRGTFVVCKTSNSVCSGYVEGVCFPTKRRGFINLAGTRKVGQGMDEDWYDHIYSVRLSRIRNLKVIKGL